MAVAGDARRRMRMRRDRTIGKEEALRGCIVEWFRVRCEEL